MVDVVPLKISPHLGSHPNLRWKKHLGLNVIAFTSTTRRRTLKFESDVSVHREPSHVCGTF